MLPGLVGAVGNGEHANDRHEAHCIRHVAPSLVLPTESAHKHTAATGASAAIEILMKEN